MIGFDVVPSLVCVGRQITAIPVEVHNTLSNRLLIQPGSLLCKLHQITIEDKPSEESMQDNSFFNQFKLSHFESLMNPEQVKNVIHEIG